MAFLRPPRGPGNCAGSRYFPSPTGPCASSVSGRRTTGICRASPLGKREHRAADRQWAGVSPSGPARLGPCFQATLGERGLSWRGDKGTESGRPNQGCRQTQAWGDGAGAGRCSLLCEPGRGRQRQTRLLRDLDPHGPVTRGDASGLVLRDGEGWQAGVERCVNLSLLLNKWVSWQTASSRR